MSEVLIFGSAGFLGSNIANYMVQHTSKRISSIDDLSGTPHLKNLQPALESKNRHTFYLAKAQDKDILSKVFEMEQPKTIIYNLCSTHLSQSTENNFAKFADTLRLAIRNAEEGNSDRLILIFNHDASYKDLSWEKKEYLYACEEAFRKCDIYKKYLLFTPYLFGPRMDPESHFISIVKNVLEGSSIPELDNTQMDFLYVKDMYSSLARFVEEDIESGAYRLAGAQYSNLQKVSDYMYNMANGNEITDITNLSKRPSEIRQTLCSPKVFECMPKYDILSALEHTLCWYDVNRWAWSKHVK